MATRLAGLVLGDVWLDPALLPALVDDGALDRLDGNRVVVEVQRAGRLAGGRADTARELGKVVGRVQHLQGILPVALVHQVVPVRNDVVDRAALVTEGNAAIHAACALLSELAVVQWNDELVVVLHTVCSRRIGALVPFVFHKSGGFTHA